MFFIILYIFRVQETPYSFAKDTVATNAMDNVDTENEGGEALSSQAVCTDIHVTTRVSVDKHHVLNICGSVIAQLQAWGVDDGAGCNLK